MFSYYNFKVYSVEICPSTRLQQGNCAVTQQCAHPEQHLFLDEEKCVDEPSNDQSGGVVEAVALTLLLIEGSG